MSIDSPISGPIKRPISSSLSLPGSSGIFGANFDGTNDYLTLNADFTGNADGKLGVFAARVRFNGGDGAVQRLYTSSVNNCTVFRAAANKIQCRLENSSGSAILNIDSTVTVIADGDYHNILISWDMAGNHHLYVDDADVDNQLVFTNDTIDYTQTTHSIGGSFAGTQLHNGDLEFIYFNVAETIDFSVVANRRKFFNSQGRTVNLGTDGSIPTGTSPILYLAGQYDTWNSNLGPGDGMTVNGALERPAS